MHNDAVVIVLGIATLGHRQVQRFTEHVYGALHSALQQPCNIRILVTFTATIPPLPKPLPLLLLMQTSVCSLHVMQVLAATLCILCRSLSTTTTSTSGTATACSSSQGLQALTPTFRMTMRFFAATFGRTTRQSPTRTGSGTSWSSQSLMVYRVCPAPLDWSRLSVVGQKTFFAESLLVAISQPVLGDSLWAQRTCLRAGMY